jgi:hypothetical protein
MINFTSNQMFSLMSKPDGAGEFCCRHSRGCIERHHHQYPPVITSIDKMQSDTTINICIAKRCFYITSFNNDVFRPLYRPSSGCTFSHFKANHIIYNVFCKQKFSVSVRRLFLVNIYGNNPKKLFVRIIRNNDIKIDEFLLFSFAFLGIVFISRCSLFISKLTIILFRDGINQILVGISSSPIAVLVQFDGRLLISVVGSKIGNKFLITFSLFY